MAGRIFISYRRADTANQAGWLAERLAGHYGRPQVVKDVDSIQLGNDFAEVIAAAVTSCDTGHGRPGQPIPGRYRPGGCGGARIPG